MKLKGKFQAGFIETVASVISKPEYLYNERMQLPEANFLSFT